VDPADDLADLLRTHGRCPADPESSEGYGPIQPDILYWPLFPVGLHDISLDAVLGQYRLQPREIQRNAA
jgi:hypothetical protein